MTLRQQLIDDLKRDEGFRNRPYECSAGRLTIGYGRNLTVKGISVEEAEILLDNDINDAEIGLKRALPYIELNNNQRRALVNMVFNLGYHGFIGFKRMLKAINERDFDRAADEILDSKYAEQVGDRAKRLADLVKND